MLVEHLVAWGAAAGSTVTAGRFAAAVIGSLTASAITGGDAISDALKPSPTPAQDPLPDMSSPNLPDDIKKTFCQQNPGAPNCQNRCM